MRSEVRSGLRGRCRTVAGLGVLAILLVASISQGAAGQYVLIKNANNKSIASVSKGDAKDLFTGKRKLWSTGEVVQIVLPAGEGGAVQWLAEDVFGVSPRNLLTKIRQEVFKGEMAKPIIAGGDDEIVKQVVSVGGALGIVAATAVLPAGAVVIPIN